MMNLFHCTKWTGKTMSHDDLKKDPPEIDYREVNAKAFIDRMDSAQRQRFLEGLLDRGRTAWLWYDRRSDCWHGFFETQADAMVSGKTVYPELDIECEEVALNNYWTSLKASFSCPLGLGDGLRRRLPLIVIK
jgi:hypothetical protein